MANAEGYVRIPRKLAESSVAPERVAALLWVVAQASYAAREVDGVALGIGETPCIPASRFEVRFRWTRKAVRVFLDWMVSERCTEETGLRIRVGQKWKGPAEGPGLGPAQGPTYLVHLAKVSTPSGPAEGPGLGPAQGPAVEKNDINSPPTGESAERGNRLKPAKVRRTPLPMTDDWAPSADTVRLAEAMHVNLPPFLLDFRGYWIERGTRRADWDATCRARIEACASSGKFLLNGNGGAHRPAQTDLLKTDAMKRLAEREAGETPPYAPSLRCQSTTK